MMRALGYGLALIGMVAAFASGTNIAGFDLFHGYVPVGSNFAEAGPATAAEAALACGVHLPGCVGFTFAECEASQTSAAECAARVPPDAASNRLYHVYFVNASMSPIALDPFWWSFVRSDWRPAASPADWSAIDVYAVLAELLSAGPTGPVSEALDAGTCVTRRPSAVALSREPPIAVLDNFLSPDEITSLVALAKGEAFVQSGYVPDELISEAIAELVGSDMRVNSETAVLYKMRVNSSWYNASEARTSTTAACLSKACKEHATVQIVLERAARLVQLPSANFEALQFTHYRPGQFFNEHNDMLPSHAVNAAGHRLVTLFIYLVAPESGGRTLFPRLGLAVDPVPGRAVVWPNVLDERLSLEDARTTHAGEAVNAGEKLGLNMWGHRGTFA